jgi:hypothetical protein
MNEEIKEKLESIFDDASFALAEGRTIAPSFFVFKGDDVKTFIIPEFTAETKDLVMKAIWFTCNKTQADYLAMVARARALVLPIEEHKDRMAIMTQSEYREEMGNVIETLAVFCMDAAGNEISLLQGEIKKDVTGREYIPEKGKWVDTDDFSSSPVSPWKEDKDELQI